MTKHEGETECEDLVHCDDLNTQTACDAEEDCEWHVIIVMLLYIVKT